VRFCCRLLWNVRSLVRAKITAFDGASKRLLRALLLRRSRYLASPRCRAARRYPSLPLPDIRMLLADAAAGRGERAALDNEHRCYARRDRRTAQRMLRVPSRAWALFSISGRGGRRQNGRQIETACGMVTGGRQAVSDRSTAEGAARRRLLFELFACAWRRHYPAVRAASPR